jgi:hypothetical protein
MRSGYWRNYGGGEQVIRDVIRVFDEGVLSISKEGLSLAWWL